MTTGVSGKISYGAVFRSGEYLALFSAHSVSVIGDQFARVALSVLVYHRTGSPAWTALAYGLTFLPDLVGGPLLSGLADRHPRRRVMIVADAARAALVALMAVPGMPLLVVCGLLVLVQLAGAPANAARAAVLPAILGEEAYPAGTAALQTVTQAGQVVGFAAGGALVAGIGTSGVLLADAGTFAVSALLVTRLRHRPAAAASASTATPAGERGWLRDLRAGATLVWCDRRLRALVAFACVSGFFIAGEALAAPYADELGGGALAVGLLFAAYPAGTAIGMLVLARLPERVRVRAMPPLAVAACVPLLFCLPHPGLVVAIALFTLSGMGSAYHVVASTTFVLLVPDERRGQAFGLAVTALKVSQGVGVAAAGLAAEAAAPHYVLAGAGALGALAALGAAALWHAAGGPAVGQARTAP